MPAFSSAAPASNTSQPRLASRAAAACRRELRAAAGLPHHQQRTRRLGGQRRGDRVGVAAELVVLDQPGGDLGGGGRPPHPADAAELGRGVALPAPLTEGGDDLGEAELVRQRHGVVDPRVGHGVDAHRFGAPAHERAQVVPRREPDRVRGGQQPGDQPVRHAPVERPQQEHRGPRMQAGGQREQGLGVAVALRERLQRGAGQQLVVAPGQLEQRVVVALAQRRHERSERLGVEQRGATPRPLGQRAQLVQQPLDVVAHRKPASSS